MMFVIYTCQFSLLFLSLRQKHGQLSSVMSESADVVITTVMVLFVITTIIGNSLVCAVIMNNRDMRYIYC